MKRTVRVRVNGPVRLAMCLAVLLAAAVPASAGDHHDEFTLEVLVDGTPVRKYASRGTTYIEALAGREYSIRLGNHTSHRVAVALSVDGLNSIDARSTTARAASKWILDPWQTITIDGWQTGPATARRFFFTTEEKSYGAWLGSTRNLGIITAAVFRERRRQPAPIAREEGEPGAPAPEARQRRLQPGETSGDEAQGAPSRMHDDLAATGIGEEVGHRVTRVAFDAEAVPAAVLDIRYEYRQALVRLGVLDDPSRSCEDPLARRERAEGFEGIRFAPDPFRRRCP